MDRDNQVIGIPRLSVESLEGEKVVVKSVFLNPVFRATSTFLLSAIFLASLLFFQFAYRCLIILRISKPT